MPISFDRHQGKEKPRPHCDNHPPIKRAIFLFIIGLTIFACQLPSFQDNPPDATETPSPPTPEPILLAEVFFWVEIPENTPELAGLQLVIIDEVTGIPFNQTRMDMIEIDPTHYGVAVQGKLGSIIKYRYERIQNGIFQEYNLEGEPVRYRMYLINGPGETRDQVARWNDTPPLKPAGRVIGNLINKSNNDPIPNLLVNVGGSWAFTSADGSFVLPSIQEGQHNLTIYALDGRFQTHQQVAQVAADAATTVDLDLEPSIFKDVTFVVNVPENTVKGAPIRIAGNLFSLGNSFTSLDGGMSGLAQRMPALKTIDDGKYSVTLNLPTGIDIRYKYTLGDGFWNAEHLADYGFEIRQIILPENNQPVLIEDSVATWQSSNSNPVWFDVTVPAYTPPEDVITIQYKLIGWTPPIPMWPIENNRWAYFLISPVNVSDELIYRYCRNGQCGESFFLGSEIFDSERAVKLNQPEAVIVEDNVTGWFSYSGKKISPFIPETEIVPRDPRFTAGIRLVPEYHPSWGPTLQDTLVTINNTNANLLIFSPTWVSPSSHPPKLFESVFGDDYSYNEFAFGIESAHQTGLSAAIYPQIRFPNGINDWWQNVSPTELWWQTFLEQYRSFIIHHAILAEEYHAEALIIGGDWLTPALPGFHGYDHIYTSQPGNINAIWSEIIQEVRNYYHGTLIWHLDFEQISNPPHTINEVDQIYLHWGVPLANETETQLFEIQSEAENLLDESVHPFYKALDKPIILCLAYPSVDGGASYNLPLDGIDSLSFPFDVLSPLAPDISTIELDLEEQADVYHAILSAVNEREWIAGVVSEGFLPPLKLEDKSISIHGKPAQEVLRYWFNQFIVN